MNETIVMARAALRYILFLHILIPGKLMSQKQVFNEIHWSLAASLPPPPGASTQPGVAGSISGITNNVLVIAGGANFPGGLPWAGAIKTYHNDIYAVVRGDTNHYATTTAPHALVRVLTNQHLPEPVAYCATVSTPNGIIYAGGENEKGITDKVYRLQYDAATGSIIIRPLPSLPLPLTNLCAAWYDNKLFVAGGESAEGPSQKFLCLDPSAIGAQWQSLPDLPCPLTYAVLIAQSNGHHGCLYIIGGRKKNTDGISTIYDRTFCYDLKAGTWASKKSLPYPLSAASGIALGANYIVVLGGDKGEVFSAVEVLVKKINTAKNEQERKALVKQKNELLAAHPGFNKDILLYNTITDAWVNTGRFPYAPAATTTAVNWNGDIIIPSGEIRAGVRTPDIIKGEVPKKTDKKE